MENQSLGIEGRQEEFENFTTMLKVIEKGVGKKVDIRKFGNKDFVDGFELASDYFSKEINNFWMPSIDLWAKIASSGVYGLTACGFLSAGYFFVENNYPDYSKWVIMTILWVVFFTVGKCAAMSFYSYKKNQKCNKENNCK